MFILQQYSQRFIVILDHKRLVEFPQLSDIQCPQLAETHMLYARVQIRNRYLICFCHSLP